MQGFWDGFEKRADGRYADHGGTLGSLIGAGLGAHSAGKGMDAVDRLTRATFGSWSNITEPVKKMRGPARLLAAGAGAALGLGLGRAAGTGVELAKKLKKN